MEAFSSTQSGAEDINKNVPVAGYHYSVFEWLSAQSVLASKGALKRCPSRVNYRQIFDRTAVTVLLGLAAFSKCELHFPLHTTAPDRVSSCREGFEALCREVEKIRGPWFRDSSQIQCRGGCAPQLCSGAGVSTHRIAKIKG